MLHDFLMIFNMFLYKCRCMFEQIRMNMFCHFSKNANTFLHMVFHLFQTWGTCVISEEYSAKRGSEPWKIVECCLGFPFISILSPELLPENIFGGSSCKHILKSAIWDPTQHSESHLGTIEIYFVCAICETESVFWILAKRRFNCFSWILVWSRKF